MPSATIPVILGAGPAGCMAAIALARAAADPVLIDRDETVGDPLCGGFMSWKTVAQLGAIGLDVAALGAHPVEKLVLFGGGLEAHSKLPALGYGLSRHALDSALRSAAVASGARLEIDHIRKLDPDCASGERRDWRSEAIFLAGGKHDIRGRARPRETDDPALGLRIRLPADDRLRALLAGRIELHLFDGGYAGIVLQESGSANICLAVRKTLLASAGGTPRALLDRLADEHPAFGERMGFAAPDLPIDTIGAVPYGWIARDTPSGLFRLGDQAAVIPSLAGEGMSIALASGKMAAEYWLAGGTEASQRYQRDFARRARRPVVTAKSIWSLAERPLSARWLVRLAQIAPPLAALAMRTSRIG